ncbi:MAG: LemA family protein, partial [Peptococcaceae bacterium]|nr:LemA family protein [Peptococcaceae bacterium]
MKQLLKNRNVAIVITVIVIVLSILGGSHRSLLAAAYSAERHFDDIQRDLDTRIGLASNLQVVAERYLYIGEDALVELDTAITNLRDAQTANEKAIANQQLTVATERMDIVLQNENLSVPDERYRIQIRTDLASYNQIIGHSKYNEKVDQYNTEVLGKFPANILAQVTGVTKLES